MKGDWPMTDEELACWRLAAKRFGPVIYAGSSSATTPSSPSSTAPGAAPTSATPAAPTGPPEPAPPSPEPSASGPVRRFETGATRDSDEGKPEYAGFLSPLVLQRFAAYMHQHRYQPDGTVRSSRNWRKGMALAVYEESLLRHIVDIWLHLEGFAGAREDLESALCGALFNTQGLLHEILVTKQSTRGRIE